jgi:hypothetical protein
MIETLKEYVVPVLRERGFKGSFPHFRRTVDRAIHLLTFQFDKWGGGFTFEIATCAPEGLTMSWGEHIPPGKVRAWDVTASSRARLGPEKSDYWFRFDNTGSPSTGDRYEAAALEVLPYLDRCEDWWRQGKDLTSRCS